MTTPPNIYQMPGMSRELLRVLAMSPAVFPGKFSPGVPSTVGLAFPVGGAGADLLAGDVLAVYSGLGSQSFVVVKAPPVDPSEVQVPNLATAAETLDAFASAMAANPSFGPNYIITRQSNVDAADVPWVVGGGPYEVLLLQNAYNDPLGFNLPGARGAISPDGTATTGGPKLLPGIYERGQNYKPGRVMAPTLLGFATVANYPPLPPP